MEEEDQDFSNFLEEDQDFSNFLESLSDTNIDHKTILLLKATSMLRDLENQLERMAREGFKGLPKKDCLWAEDLVADLRMMVKHPTFQTFFKKGKNFDFAFDSLQNLHLNSWWGHVYVLEILYDLPMDDLSEQKYKECMLANIEFFANIVVEGHCDYKFALETGSEFRQKLAYNFIPQPLDDEEQLFVEIDRQILVSDSIRKIIDANADDLVKGIRIGFKDEAGEGDGVRREWLISLVEEMVAESEGAFQSTGDDLQHDDKRFYAKRGSSKSLDYYRCFGRVIALALIHEIPVGITFDNTLFLQLGYYDITLEDIRETAPAKYKSYHDILQYGENVLEEAEIFIYEDIDELIPSEKGQVTIENREEFISDKIYLEFVESVRTQTEAILQGMDDLLSTADQTSIFHIIKLEDLDLMIRGILELQVEDWMRSTKYEGYNDTDDAIVWFWQIVTDLKDEEKTKLLNFWAAHKSLPQGGFEALDPPLVISKWQDAEGLLEHLPISQTCCRTLCFPPYESYGILKKKLLYAIDDGASSFLMT